MPGPRSVPLHVGLIGHGLAGGVFHAPLINAVPDLSLDLVMTADPRRQEAARRGSPAARVVATADDFWGQAAGLDLVVVAAPNKAHVGLARTALELGLAVVVDKPMAPTAAEALELAELAESRGLVLSVFQNRRWDADFLTLRQLLAEDRLGDIWRFESRYERWRPQLKGGWRESGDPVEVGGLLYDLGSHIIDQALVLFGPVRTVYAEVRRRRPAAEVDDDVFVALQHVNGVCSHLWMSSTAAQLGPRFRALGSQGAFVKWGIDPQEEALKQGRRPGPGWGEEPIDEWGWLGAGPADGPGGHRVPTVAGDYPAYYRALAAAVAHGGAPPVGAREAAASLAVIQAAAASAARGGQTVVV